MTIEILHGCCLEQMAAMKAAGRTVQAIVTDPPYHLTSINKRYSDPGAAPIKSDGETGVFKRIAPGFMGKVWDGGDIAFRPETWRLAYDLLPPGGHMAVFGGSRTHHRLACAIEDAGFEIRDCLMWVHSQGFPKSKSLLKPAYEPIVLARKPGPLAPLNIDACRVPISAGQLPSDGSWDGDQNLCVSCAEDAARKTRRGKPATRASTATGHAEPTSSGRGGISLADTNRPDTGCSVGTRAASTAISSNTDGYGRIHTGQSLPGMISTTSTETEPTTGLKTCDACGVTITAKSMQSTKPPMNGEPPIQHARANTEPPSVQGRWPSNLAHDNSPEVLDAFARFGEKNGGARPARRGGLGSSRTMPSTSQGTNDGVRLELDRGTAARFFPALPFSDQELRFFYGAKASRAERGGSKHPTIKPVSVCRWLARLITPPGGTILDPFCGSGTTLEAAQLEGFNAIGCEKEAEYIGDIRRRCGLEAEAAD